MAKEITGKIKLNIAAGKATPAPPVGPALGQKGVPIMEFCNAFNEKTRELGDVIVPVLITVFEDRTFEFIMKTPPTSSLLLKAVGAEKGSANPKKVKLGSVSADQIRTIAETKLPDLNTRDIEQAIRVVSGTARGLGIDITE